MQYQFLATLRELRDRGSVTAVAEALHMSPSAVSQQLAALQRGTQVRLTRKQGRNLALTEAGHRLVDAAQELFDAAARCDEVLHGLAGTSQTPVHVAAFHSAAEAFFPDLVTDPELDVRCHDHDVPLDEFVALTGDVDIVIAHRDQAPVAVITGVTRVPLMAEPLDIALRRDHPAGQAPLTLDVLSTLDWISVHQDFPLAGHIDSLAAQAGSPLVVAHRINEFPTTLAILARSDCAALMPRHLHPDLDGRVELHPAPGLPLVRHVDALVRTDQLARANVRNTLARLQQLGELASRR